MGSRSAWQSSWVRITHPSARDPPPPGDKPLSAWGPAREGMPLWWGRGPAAAPPPGRCPGVFLLGLLHGLPLDVPSCLALPSHRLSSQTRGLRSSPTLDPGWGGDTPQVCPSASCLLVSPTGRDPENNQEALENFQEFARAKGLKLEILELAQSGRKGAFARSCPVAPSVALPESDILGEHSTSDPGFALPGAI